MFSRFSKWRENLRRRLEIDGLSRRELHDMGVTRGELLSIAAVGGRITDRQLAMARRHGLDEDDLRRSPHDLVVSVRACAGCGATDRCARYLSSAAPASAAASFCPNHRLYRQLARD